MREQDNFSDHSSPEFIMKDHQPPSSSSLSGKKRKETESSSSGIINNNDTPRACTECGKKFWSWKALFGHMRCHPERQWRGINPPPNFRRHQHHQHHQHQQHQQQQPHTLSHSYGTSSSMTPEDHEVAACLLLLANSKTNINSINKPAKLKAVAAVTTVAATADDSSSGIDQEINNSNAHFVCLCCNKVFGSHQALGGHRASHKNVKGCFANTTTSSPVTASGSRMLTWTQQTQGGGDHAFVVTGGGGGGDHRDDEFQHHAMMNLMTVPRDGYNADVEGETVMESSGGHKCGICLRVFTTGQALGGHKRCHFDSSHSIAATTNSNKSSSSSLNVDLNFPFPPLPPPPPSPPDAADNPDNHDSSPPLTLDLKLGL